MILSHLSFCSFLLETCFNCPTDKKRASLNLRVSSLGMEVLEVMPDPDVVVVCCGGGGLLAGVAAAVKLSGCDKTRIYGVEPEGGKTSTEEPPHSLEAQ